MATITRYVNTASTAGGDGTTNATVGANRAYPSLTSWDAAEQTDLDTANNLHEVHCEGTAAETSIVSIDGWTLSATDYIRIVVDQAVRHDGKWNTGTYRLEVTDTVGMDIFESFVKVEGVQVQVTATSGARRAILQRGDSGEFTACILRAVISGAATTVQGIEHFGGGTSKVKNCLLYDFVNASTVCRGLFQDGGGTAYWHNNTTHNCWLGFADGFGTTHATNCGAASSTSAGFTGTFTTNTTNSSTTPTFVDEANDDFHLASGDTTWKDAGTDLSAHANLAVTDDIDGVARSGTWDIGADEFAAAGPAFIAQQRTVIGQAVQRSSVY